AAGVCAVGGEQSAPPLTCRCWTVNTTGSERYTLLLSLLIDAVMTGEFTITDLTLFLYSTKAILISPVREEMDKMLSTYVKKKKSSASYAKLTITCWFMGGYLLVL
uniref:Uncharacterized protein n=1 Tax=Xiphophorus maculatus TaxID=8083 RepID=A0A3B5QJW8_XIPMA